MEEAEVEMNKQCEGEVYLYGLIKRGESDGASLWCWEGGWRPASLAIMLTGGFLAL